MDSLLPLYDTVKNFASYNESDEVFYIFQETKVGETRYRYEGQVGYGCPAEEFVEVRRELGEDISIEEVDAQRRFCIPVHFFDSSTFKFEFNTETRIVDICSSLSIGGCHDDHHHIQQLPTIELIVPSDAELESKVGSDVEKYRKILEYEYIRSDWSASYLRIRFPRTKDEVAAALVLEHMFAKVGPVRIRYPLLFNVH